MRETSDLGEYEYFVSARRELLHFSNPAFAHFLCVPVDAPQILLEITSAALHV